MVEIGNSDTKNLWKTPYFAHKCKAKVVSEFHLLQRLFHSEFPHLLQCSESSFGNHSAHPVHTQKTPGERHRPSCFYKGSQVSFCLRCQDKEQSCSHCPRAMIWYLRRMKKKKEKAGKMLLNCVFQPKQAPPLFYQQRHSSSLDFNYVRHGRQYQGLSSWKQGQLPTKL